MIGIGGPLDAFLVLTWLSVRLVVVSAACANAMAFIPSDPSRSVVKKRSIRII
jgi:hypothetical protein